MSNPILSKCWIYEKPFDGLPKESDLKMVEKEVEPLKEGEFLCEAIHLSVDPYMRYMSNSFKPGQVMVGGSVSRIIESKNSNYPVGTLIMGHGGWRTHFIGSKRWLALHPMNVVIPIKLEDPSLALSLYGLTGLTAYFGLLDVCNPKEGETLFVNTTAGAVGAAVAQIGKIKGCRVVGCAGSDDKVEYLKKELGLDGVFNYKTEDIDTKLKEFCPNGIDCFFDNVGGSMFDTVMKNMNQFGRAAICGAISMYNESSVPKGPYIHSFVIRKEIKVQGFMAPSYMSRYHQAVKDLKTWFDEGKIKQRQHVVEGFEKMPKAFISLFHGTNIGKVVVKV